MILNNINLWVKFQNQSNSFYNNLKTKTFKLYNKFYLVIACESIVPTKYCQLTENKWVDLWVIICEFICINFMWIYLLLFFFKLLFCVSFAESLSDVHGVLGSVEHSSRNIDLLCCCDHMCAVITCKIFLFVYNQPTAFLNANSARKSSMPCVKQTGAV